MTVWKVRVILGLHEDRVARASSRGQYPEVYSFDGFKSVPAFSHLGSIHKLVTESTSSNLHPVLSACAWQIHDVSSSSRYVHSLLRYIDITDVPRLTLDSLLEE